MTAVLSTLTSFATVFAGLGWEPEIRGALTVAIASAVLMGSLWLLLVTNSGTRLGSLIALASFFGWMFLMGLIWWIYGIGWTGSSPRWEIKEFVTDPAGYEVDGIRDAVTGPAFTLPDTNCNLATVVFPPEADFSYSGPQGGCSPRAIEVLLAYPDERREAVFEELLNTSDPNSKIAAIVADGTPTTDRDAVFAQLLERSEAELRAVLEASNATIDPDDPRYRDAAGIDAEVASLVSRRNTRIDDLSLSALAAIGPDVITFGEEQGWIDFGEWNLLSTAQSGEAVASADAALKENAVFGDAATQFIVLDAFQQGGKPKRDGDGIIDRVWFKITSTVRITHPTNYAVVQTQYAVQQQPEAGQLPPLPMVDDEVASVSVVMERNLGNLRLIPALMSIFSLLMFLACCLVLHLRDLTLRERLS